MNHCPDLNEIDLLFFKRLLNPLLFKVKSVHPLEQNKRWVIVLIIFIHLKVRIDILLTEKGCIALTVNGEALSMTEDELLIETKKAEGFVSENDRELTVAIDTTITAELEEEGLVRELKRKLQTMRKAAGFEVTDRIKVSYKASSKVKALFEKFAEDISSVVLADSIEEREPSGYVDSKSIQGEDAVIGVEKV